MSGLVGFYDPEQILPKQTLEKMLQLVKKSDSNNDFFIKEKWGGFAVDNFSGLTSSIQFGENFVGIFGELDTIIQDYEIFQNNDLTNLEKARGCFAAICLDKQNQKITLFTDHVGSYPFYICHYKSAVLFATQIKAIIVALPYTPNLDKHSVAMMLSIGEVLGNRTLIEAIETLPAASITKLGVEKSQHIYWRYLHQENKNLNRNDLIDKTGEALKIAVKRAVSNREHANVPLSGGLDSRFLLDLARAHVKLDAYTWGVQNCRDIRYAQQATSIAQCPHHVYYFENNYLERVAEKGIWLTEGHTTTVNFHVLPFLDEIKIKQNSVLLDGFAGDAIVGGNFISPAWKNNPDFKNAGICLWNWRLSAFVKSDEVKKQLEPFHFVAREAFSELYCTYSGETSMDKAMAFLLDNRVRRITTCGTEMFRSKIIVKQPFMDIDVIDATRILPHDLKIRHQFYLDVLKRYAPDTAKAAWQRTALPASSPYYLNWLSLAMQRGYSEARNHFHFLPDILKNKSVSHFDEWFRQDLKNFVEKTLFSSETIEKNLIPTDAIKTAWLLHQENKIDATALIGSALTIVLFSKVFLENKIEPIL